ncbi:MAG: hypothetical protein MUF54_01215 [Polyangiaceae bacterium]|nr:hypothetical protein [Polyangiaceae bacterium]
MRDSWGRHPGFVQVAHAAWVHDPLHVIQRASKAIDELGREMLLRASPELRAAGRGKR